MKKWMDEIQLTFKIYAMGKGRPEKYNRVSSQQKFMLRRLIVKEKMSVKQASENLNINYSTAKTIMFAYRQNSIDYHSFSPSLSKGSNFVEATYMEATIGKPIMIVSSIGGGDWIKADLVSHESTNEQKQLQI